MLIKFNKENVSIPTEIELNKIEDQKKKFINRKKNRWQNRKKGKTINCITELYNILEFIFLGLYYNFTIFRNTKDSKTKKWDKYF